MAESDDKWQVGKINKQSYVEFLSYLDRYTAAVGTLSETADGLVALLAGFIGELPSEDYPDAGEMADDARAAILEARSALDAFSSRPEIGYELFGYSHRRRISKRVEARQ